MAKTQGTSDGYMPRPADKKAVAKRVPIVAGDPKMPWANHGQKVALKKAAKSYSQDKIMYSHLAEMDRKKADATNLGHNVSDTSIGSKTTKGYLTTSAGDKGISHKWGKS